MKILNLYAGIGGNRKLWGDEHEVTAIENVGYIADAYRQLYPNDTVIVGDAHEYLMKHYDEFDFIWSSPPCPTHSKMNLSFQGENRKHLLKYPDMALYQEIIFLKHFYKGNWVVENVVGYYEPLIHPQMILDRHFFWSNFPIQYLKSQRQFNLAKIDRAGLSEHHGITLPDGTKDQRKLLRNAVDPELGQAILKASLMQSRQETLL